MDQYRKLWPGAGGAPHDVQLHEQLLRHGRPALRRDHGLRRWRVGLGVNPARQPSVDGYNPLAVADAVTRKKEILLAGPRPLCCSIPSPIALPAIRPPTPRPIAPGKRWTGRQHDSLIGYRAYLVENGFASDADLDAISEEVIDRLVKVLTAAVNDDLVPRGAPDSEYVSEIMFTNRKRDKVRRRRNQSVVLQTKKRGWRRRRPVPAMPTTTRQAPSQARTLTYAEALFEAMMEGFYRDPTMVAFGEENRDWGGALASTAG